MSEETCVPHCDEHRRDCALAWARVREQSIDIVRLRAENAEISESRRFLHALQVEYLKRAEAAEAKVLSLTKERDEAMEAGKRFADRMRDARSEVSTLTAKLAQMREALEQLSRYSGDEAPNWVRMAARNALSRLTDAPCDIPGCLKSKDHGGRCSHEPAPEKCDGNHAFPVCSDKECWNIDAPEGKPCFKHQVENCASVLCIPPSPGKGG